MRELKQEEGEAFNKELLELLEKHNVEVSVASQIVILKREEETKDEGIPSPFTIADNEQPKTE